MTKTISVSSVLRASCSALLTFAFVSTAAADIPENKAFVQLAEEDACPPADEPKDPSIWDKSALFGFNLSEGNSETELISLRLNASRDYAGEIWDFSASARYGTQKTEESEGRSEVTQEDIKAAGSYKRLISKRLYAGFATDFLYDDVAGVDYRVSLTPPLGYFLVREPTVKLSLEAGPGYVFEKLEGKKNNYFAPFIGERFEWEFSAHGKFYQSAEVLFDAEDADNYLVRSEAGLEAALTERFSLVVAVEDIYDNVPAEDKKKNDLIVSTALKVSL